MEIYLDYIIENMTSGLIVIDLTGKITVFNRAAEEISKFKRELVIGRSYSEIFREDAESRNSLLYTLKYNNPVLNAESVIVSLNGEMIPIRFSTSLVKDNNGLLLGAMKIFHDLTEIKKLEDEIQQTRTLAALGEMAASIAHEIRNPLGGIGGFAALLEREFEITDPRRNMVKKIMEGVARLDKIVGDLLIFTRPLKAKFRTVNLKNLLNEILDFIQLKLKQEDKNIKICKIYPKHKLLVRIDEILFQQMMCTIFNSIVQMVTPKQEVKVEIKLLDSNQEILLIISDNRPGIPLIKGTNSLLFTNGPSLGLTLVKKIVECHHGYFHIESQEDKGTTFTIILPGSLSTPTGEEIS